MGPVENWNASATLFKTRSLFKTHLELNRGVIPLFYAYDKSKLTLSLQELPSFFRFIKITENMAKILICSSLQHISIS